MPRPIAVPPWLRWSLLPSETTRDAAVLLSARPSSPLVASPDGSFRAYRDTNRSSRCLPNLRPSCVGSDSGLQRHIRFSGRALYRPHLFRVTRRGHWRPDAEAAQGQPERLCRLRLSSSRCPTQSIATLASRGCPCRATVPLPPAGSTSLDMARRLTTIWPSAPL